VTRAELDDERAFLLDSLEDLERERAAGDLSEADYAALRDRYTQRAADVLRALDRDDSAQGDGSHGRTGSARTARSSEAGSSEAGSSGEVSAGASSASSGRARSEATATSPRRRRALLVAGLTALLGAAAITLVATQSGTRLPGQTATGSVSLSRAAEVLRTRAQAEALEAAGNATGALGLYHQVLSLSPNDGVALAESGWLEFQAGVQARDARVLADAQLLEEKAQRVEPGAFAPHLYLGSMLLAEGDAGGAVAQYRQFLADGPPQSEVRAAQPYIAAAFTKARLPVPSMSGTNPNPGAPTATTSTTRAAPAG
jgi:tetratricopeptide (TPR) repeat protein